MEGKPTAKPSQESGPQTRKRIVIKKNPAGCESNVTGGKRAKRTNKKTGAVKTRLLVLAYPKKVIQAF